MSKASQIAIIAGLALFVLGTATFVYADALSERLAGKIVLAVEENGEAWYIHPESKTRYYLGRPADAFEIMRKLGLGISNLNLAGIPIAPDSPVPPGPQVEREWKVTKRFSGNSSVTTETFYITEADQIKVRYTYTAGAFSDFRIILGNKNNVFDDALIFNGGIENFETINNETNIYHKTTNAPYYFNVTANGNWSIDVLEYL